MKATFIEEPLLEFAGGGRHIDPKHGVWHYGPADIKDPTPRVVRAAIIGPQASIDGLETWLDKCRRGIGALTDTHLTHLYVPFPGFDVHHGFRSIINFSPRLTGPSANATSTPSTDSIRCRQLRRQSICTTASSRRCTTNHLVTSSSCAGPTT